MADQDVWHGQEQSCPVYGVTRFTRMSDKNGQYTVMEVKVWLKGTEGWIRAKYGVASNPVETGKDNKPYLKRYEDGKYYRLVVSPAINEKG